jgi:anti-anti-sigma regulatory factor
MTSNPVWIRVDPECVVDTLENQAVEQLKGAGSEMILDLSGVRRIDANVARAMEALADRGDAASVKIALNGVNVDIYKVLKLLKLTGRFSFPA